jgi:cell division protein FtsW (lipid II flippase)
MDDLYILLILVITASVVLFFMGFPLWWAVLILGLGIYFIISIMVTRSTQLSTTQIYGMKDEIGRYLSRKIEQKGNLLLS